MEDIEETLKKIGGSISKENTATTSTPETGGETPCPHCGGMGFVHRDVPVGHPDFGKAFPCVCQLREQADDRAADLRRLGGLDALVDKTFDSFIPEPPGLSHNQVFSLALAYKRARTYAEAPDGWMLLQGTYGCGKTHLAAAVANRQVELGNLVLFVNVPDLLDHLRAAYSPNAVTSYDERFEQIRNAPLVVLDDLGAESPTSWAQEKLYQICNYRYMRRLPTVITTNVDVDRLDPRIRSRLTDQNVTELVPINAPDHRRGSGSTGPGYSDISSLHLYGHMTFDNFDLRENLPREHRDNLRMVFDATRAYADELERIYKPAREYATLDELPVLETRANWLVIMGGYGTGKTHLAAAIANHFQAPDHPVIFVTVPDLLDHLRATYAPGSDVTYDKRFAQIRNAPLLILDDLGTESATPWAREKLFQLLNYRYVAPAPTVFTTAEDLENLDPRLVSRLLDRRRCEIKGITVPSYRGGRR